MKTIKFNRVISVIAATTTLAISALSCLSLSGLEHSAQAKNNCARFYKNRNLRGASFSLCLTNSMTVPSGFNNQISSFEMPEGRQCILYNDAGFKGRHILYIETGTVNLQPQFDNQVSSIQCTTA